MTEHEPSDCDLAYRAAYMGGLRQERKGWRTWRTCDCASVRTLGPLRPVISRCRSIAGWSFTENVFSLYLILRKSQIRIDLTLYLTDFVNRAFGKEFVLPWVDRENPLAKGPQT